MPTVFHISRCCLQNDIGLHFASLTAGAPRDDMMQKTYPAPLCVELGAFVVGCGAFDDIGRHLASAAAFVTGIYCRDAGDSRRATETNLPRKSAQPVNINWVPGKRAEAASSGPLSFLAKAPLRQHNGDMRPLGCLYPERCRPSAAVSEIILFSCRSCTVMELLGDMADIEEIVFIYWKPCQ